VDFPVRSIENPLFFAIFLPLAAKDTVGAVLLFSCGGERDNYG